MDVDLRWSTGRKPSDENRWACYNCTSARRLWKIAAAKWLAATAYFWKGETLANAGSRRKGKLGQKSVCNGAILWFNMRLRYV
jgi:hypothetical protein